ncbi:aminotransferase class V-fold PLP-dependent enzyme [Schlegelella sp. S2-27]|uniref:Aminotransferase class V-fold PLP-dependent enzyme n=1 Tax=Caldimonas mangrovi TaxID=2944811 RepID=A0ABT0YJ78_9BURK|nr:aminotransferase class V-fold PLP-dependent enzyme [Caldimonas mangrovi]MCM5678454.1 aminotransferase class V-fold PLP-dependent enzyme [Caldimonas mangrovi]
MTRELEMDDLQYRTPAFEQALVSLPTPSANASGDDAYWERVRALYHVSDRLVNLENGYWGAMPEPVKSMYAWWTERINHENSLWVRERWARAVEALRAEVAAALGCEADEIVLTRGATEAMLALIGGYRRLRPGDTVLYSDLDYPAMRHAMAWLHERRGVEPVCFSIPEPATRENVLAAYEEQLRRHPRTRLLLLTHLSHSTGLMMPVREIAEMARAAGAETIVDAAHSWGQVDFRPQDLGVSFVGFNLHKWVAAPLGCGCLYIKRGEVGAIDRYFGDRDHAEDDIRSRIHTGSPNFAAWLTLPAALELHRRISAAAKGARLRHLRSLWVEPARRLPGLAVLTPDDPTMVAGITAFRLDGKTSAADNDAIVATLRDRHGVFTVRRDGPAAGDVVRVTPALYTRAADVMQLVRGLEALGAGHG